MPAEHRIFMEQLDRARRQSGHTQTSFAKLCGVTTTIMGEYLRGGRQPGFDTLRRISVVTGVSLTQLVFGTPARRIEEAASEFERAYGERIKGEWRDDNRSVTTILKRLRVNRWKAGAMHSALLRFSRTLRGGENPDSPWVARREEMMAAAARFLVRCEEAFQYASFPRGVKTGGARMATSGLLLAGSSSLGWKATQYDAMLTLFASRVIGLGERQSDNWLDVHAPTAAHRRLTYETLWSQDDNGPTMTEVTPEEVQKRARRAARKKR